MLALGALGEKAITLYHSYYHLPSNHLYKPVTSEIKTVRLHLGRAGCLEENSREGDD